MQEGKSLGWEDVGACKRFVARKPIQIPPANLESRLFVLSSLRQTSSLDISKFGWNDENSDFETEGDEEDLKGVRCNLGWNEKLQWLSFEISLRSLLNQRTAAQNMSTNSA